MFNAQLLVLWCFAPNCLCFDCSFSTGSRLDSDSFVFLVGLHGCRHFVDCVLDEALLMVWVGFGVCNCDS